MKYAVAYGSSSEKDLARQSRFSTMKLSAISVFGRWVKHIAACCVALMLCPNTTYAQEKDFEVMINFKVNSHELDSTYSSNAEELRKLDRFVQTLKSDTLMQITSIRFSGASSPEGPLAANHRLAVRRMQCLENVIRSKMNIGDVAVTYNDSLVRWDKLEAMVSRTFPTQYRDTLQSIIRTRMAQPDNMHNDLMAINAIKGMYSGRIYRTLADDYFPEMRNACAMFVTFHKPQPVAESEPQQVEVEQTVAPDTIIYNKVDTVQVAEPVLPETEEPWRPKWYIKSNAAAWAFAIANLAAEIDIAEHWSVALPVYYSAWNYFSHKVKFRTFAIQPEARFWLNENNDGLFAGAHLGLAYYNFATGGDYRTQDHNRRTPAWGGGLSVGYRLPLGKNSRWKMEFSVGAGVYPVKYDKFINEHNGLLAYTDKKTYVGLDQLNISIAYTFDTLKKGGKR